ASSFSTPIVIGLNPPNLLVWLIPPHSRKCFGAGRGNEAGIDGDRRPPTMRPFRIQTCRRPSGSRLPAAHPPLERGRLVVRVVWWVDASWHRRVVGDSANDNAWQTPPHRSRGMR